MTAIGGSFDPSGKFFYLSGGPSGGILGFRVDTANGSLTALPGSPFALGSTLGSPTLDPSGGFLFAGDFPNSAIAEFRVDATGALARVGSTPAGGSPENFTIVLAP